MPREEIALGVFVGSEVSDIDREIKAEMRKLFEGDEGASRRIHDLSRRREGLIMPGLLRGGFRKTRS